MPDDNVLFQARKKVNLTRRGCFCQDSCCLLEARGRDEALRRQRHLRDAQKERRGLSRLALLFHDRFIGLLEGAAVNLLAHQELRIAGIIDADLLEHHRYDQLNMLIIDAHPLEAVHFLDLIEQIFLEDLVAADTQDVLRNDRAFRELLPGKNFIALIHRRVLAVRNGVFFRHAGRALDDDGAVAAAVLAELDEPVDLGNDSRVLRTARFKELGDTRQTAGDVARLLHAAGDLRDQFARADDRLVIDKDVRADGNGIDTRHFAAGGHDDLRMIFLLVFDDHALRDTGDRVRFAAESDFLDELLEIDLPLDLSDDRDGVRVPLRENNALLNLLSVGDRQGRSLRQLVTLVLAAILVVDRNGAVTVKDDIFIALLHDAQLMVFHIALVLGTQERLFDGARCRAADMERSHGQLRAGFTDGLRRDDTDGLAHLDETVRGQVAAVTLDAGADLGFAGQRAADADLFDAQLFNELGLLLGDLFARHDRALVGDDIDNAVESHAPDDALLERYHDLVALDDRSNCDAVGRAAILLGNNDLLRHIDQAARQITGVGRLKSGIRKTLAGAVRGDEIFKHGQPLAETRRDRVLDDLARGLGHQAAHPGELADL